MYYIFISHTYKKNFIFKHTIEIYLFKVEHFYIEFVNRKIIHYYRALGVFDNQISTRGLKVIEANVVG